MTRPLCVMLVAAEASGDNLGAGLAEALRSKLDGRVRFVGVGGERMRAAGVESFFPIADLSILGLVEGLLAYPRVRRRAAEAVRRGLAEAPDVAVLIDSWGFTLRVAQGLRRSRADLPLVKYVGPQVWASRPGRARTLAATVDRLLSIHAFDGPYFEQAGLETVFVGNPGLMRDFSRADPERFRRHIGAGPDDPILLVLPGSRPAEVARLLGPFRDAVARLASAYPGLKVAVPLAPTVAEAVRAGVADWPAHVRLVEDAGLKDDAMRAATVALACSGSVTTELALAGCPVVVAYRLGHLTHLIARSLIRTPYVTLFNIAAGREVAPELIQDRCTGEALAHEIRLRLDDPDLRARQVADQFAALDRMGRGEPGRPAERAAEAVLDLLAIRPD